MDTRLIAAGVASLIGLVAGGGLWALSGGKAQSKDLAAIDARLDAISTRVRPGLDRPSDALAQALAMPLFGAATVVTDQQDASVQLAGIVRSPSRVAALLAIGGAPAQWLSVGESHGGVSLQSVSSGGVTLMTPNGARDVLLGAPGAASGPPDGAPAGFRSPPPPASAPGSN